MDKALEQDLKIMAQIAKPTPTQIDNLISGWEEYFLRYGVSEGKQRNEFQAVIRARLYSNCVSIVAPS